MLYSSGFFPVRPLTDFLFDVSFFFIIANFLIASRSNTSSSAPESSAILPLLLVHPIDEISVCYLLYYQNYIHRSWNQSWCCRGIIAWPGLVLQHWLPVFELTLTEVIETMNVIPSQYCPKHQAADWSWCCIKREHSTHSLQLLAFSSPVVQLRKFGWPHKKMPYLSYTF